MVVWLFKALVAAHIVTGTVGLISLWVPIVGRKGGAVHKKWGVVFARSLLLTGGFAVGISICTLIAPLETHPFWDDPVLVSAVFGWMMLYLATMTINLANYGRLCIQNRQNHAANRTAVNLFLQAATFFTALNCAIQGWRVEQPLLVGMSIVGLAAGFLNTRFILRRNPPANEWLIQHSRGLVGAGISVYTAFLAFGAVNLMPQFAFSPVLWATPCVLGVTYLLYHQVRIMLARYRKRAAKPTPPARASGPALPHVGQVKHP
ncbi:MAG: hypothetical protein AAF552_14415 [Pseudomonadota bacterium]